MEKYETAPPLPKEPATGVTVESPSCPPPLPPNEQPPPPPLQTSSDAEVMDVGSGGDGQSDTPAGDDTHTVCGTQLLTKGSSCYKSRLIIVSNSDQSPRTARHAPSLRKFTPDLKLLKDVKISVSFTESCKSKDRKVLYTGAEQDYEKDSDLGINNVNGHMHVCPLGGDNNDQATHVAGEKDDKKDYENDVDQEKRVEYAVLDDLEEFTDNLMEIDEGGGFTSKAIVQRDKVDEETLNYSYEVSKFYFCVLLLFFARRLNKNFYFLISILPFLAQVPPPRQLINFYLQEFPVLIYVLIYKISFLY